MEEYKESAYNVFVILRTYYTVFQLSNVRLLITKAEILTVEVIKWNSQNVQKQLGFHVGHIHCFLL